ncbi:glycosyltransferase family 2 protein [Candidatus Bathyarchaeota archaeon]|nr:glycosyltransferase family 2 protein [Candidatus Bathyarchaeota archaeon]
MVIETVNKVNVLDNPFTYNEHLKIEQSAMKKIEPQYWTLLLTRNGAETVQLTAESIMHQTIPPVSMCIVDDGSSDDTPLILEELRHKYPERVNVVTLQDEGYDIRRVVKNINVGVEAQKKEKIKAEYIMISGDDCVYPPRYAEHILVKMNRDHRIVVASGDIEGIPHPDVTPRGSGRFIRTRFFHKIGGHFPPYYGYEGWIFQKALQLGYSTKNYSDIRYRHLRELGKQHGFITWGLAMKCLGYHPLEVLYRCIKYVLIDRRVPVGYIRVLWNYFIQPLTVKGDPYYHSFDEDVRTYIREKQKRRTIHEIANLLGLNKR